MIRKNAKIGFNLGSLKIAAGDVTKEGNSSNSESTSVVVDNTAQETSKDAVGFGSFGKIYNEVTSKPNTTEDDKADDADKAKKKKGKRKRSSSSNSSGQ